MPTKIVAVTPDQAPDDDLPAPVSRKHLRPKRPKKLRPSDFRETLLIGLAACAVRCLPPREWHRLSDTLFRFERGRGRGRYRRFNARARAVFGPAVTEKNITDLWQQFRTQSHRRRLQIVAERMQAGESMKIRLEGREKLDTALARGNGAILWFDSFVHHSTIGSRALHEAGYVCWHMSSSDHGFSTSTFGKRYLNPIRLRAEGRYIAGRIEFDPNSALTATRAVCERLAENGIVRITNNAYIGRRIVDVPFGVSASLPVAPAPLKIGSKVGAPVFPVSVIEVVPFQDYVVTIAPPFDLQGGSKEAALAAALTAYRCYLEPLVLAHPEQWLGWLRVRERQPSG